MTDPIYFVERNFGSLGRAFIETDRNTSRRQIVDAIASGEIEDVLTVLEIYEDEGTSRNITEDIAREVRDHFVNEQLPMNYETANWLHQQLGVNSVAWPEAAE